jgi:hypothetical protein
MMQVTVSPTTRHSKAQQVEANYDRQISASSRRSKHQRTANASQNIVISKAYGMVNENDRDRLHHHAAKQHEHTYGNRNIFPPKRQIVQIYE